MKKLFIFFWIISFLVINGQAQEWEKTGDFIGLDAYCSLSGNYVGTSNGMIEYSPLTKEWKHKGLQGRKVYSLYKETGTLNDTLIAGTDQGIYYSPDRGATWVLTNAPQQAYRQIIHKATYSYTRFWYASSDNGVYYAVDDLKNWKLLGLQGQKVANYVDQAADTVAVFATDQGLILTGENYGTKNKTATHGIANVVDMVVYWTGFYEDSKKAFLANDKSVYLTDKDSLYFSKTNNYSFEKRWTAPDGVTITWIHMFTNGNILIGTSKGLYNSTDKGVNFSKWDNINNHMTSMNYPMEGYTGYNSFYFTTLGGGYYNTYALTGYSNIQTLQLAPDGSMWVGTTGFGVYRSADKGKTWEERNTGLTSLDVRDIEISSNGDMYLATRNGAFLSTNKGVSWQSIRPQNFMLYSILEAHPHDGITLFGSGKNSFIRLGSDFNWNDGGRPLTDDIYVIRYHPKMNKYVAAGKYGMWTSATDYVYWTAVSSFPSYSVYDLEVDKDGRILAVTNGAVYYSDNNGADWQTTAHIPKNYKKDLVIDAQGNYFVATDGGVYFSTDRGASWKELNAGFPNLPYSALIDCIALDTENHLWAGSTATGLFRTVSPVTAYTAIGEVVLRSALKAIYHPQSNRLIVSLPEVNSEWALLTIYSVTGAEIASQRFSILPGNSTLELDIPWVEQGVYTLMLKCADGIRTGKFLK